MNAFETDDQAAAAAEWSAAGVPEEAQWQGEDWQADEWSQAEQQLESWAAGALYLNSFAELQAAAPMMKQRWATTTADGWTCIYLMVDSGCGKSAAPPSVGNLVAIIPSAVSKSGVPFQTASGQAIHAKGNRTLSAKIDGHDLKMVFEIVDITRPLLAVSDLARRGFVSSFWHGGGQAEHWPSGLTLNFTQSGGTYYMKVWIPPEEMTRVDASDGDVDMGVMADKKTMPKKTDHENEVLKSAAPALAYWKRAVGFRGQ